MENKLDILNETVRRETNLSPASSIKLEVKNEPPETLDTCSSVYFSKAELNHSFKQGSQYSVEHAQLKQDASTKVESDSIPNQFEVELKPEDNNLKGELKTEEYNESMLTEEYDLPIKCEDEFEEASASKPQSEVKRKQKKHKFLYPSIKESIALHKKWEVVENVEKDREVVQYSKRKKTIDSTIVNENDKFLETLNRSKEIKEKLGANNEDEDRLFMLSLVGTLKKVPSERKMVTKIKIMSLLENATRDIESSDTYGHPCPQSL